MAARRPPGDMVCVLGAFVFLAAEIANVNYASSRWVVHSRRGDIRNAYSLGHSAQVACLVAW